MQKPTERAPTRCTALERLWQSAEERCNSDEGLLRLAKALLTHKPKSDTERRYIRALVQYVFAKRRHEIYRKRGLVLSPCTQGACLESEVEIAREYRDSIGQVLAYEEGEEAVRKLRQRIGSQLSFAGAYRQLSRDLVTFAGD